MRLGDHTDLAPDDTDFRIREDKNMDKNRAVATAFKDDLNTDAGLSIGWNKDKVSDASMEVFPGSGPFKDVSKRTQIYCNSVHKLD